MADLQPAQPHIQTVDGEPMELQKARKQCRILFYCGFLCLPFLWMCNFWLFWPDWRGKTVGRPSDPVLRQYCSWSSMAFAAYTALFLPWMLFYVTVGDKYLDPTVYHRLDTASLPITKYIGI